MRRTTERAAEAGGCLATHTGRAQRKSRANKEILRKPSNDPDRPGDKPLLRKRQAAKTSIAAAGTATSQRRGDSKKMVARMTMGKGRVELKG